MEKVHEGLISSPRRRKCNHILFFVVNNLYLCGVKQKNTTELLLVNNIVNVVKDRLGDK